MRDLHLRESLSITRGWHEFWQHKGFEEVFPAPGVNVDSSVSVSITEVDGHGQPFQGLASCRVDNVVPEGVDQLRVRGEIGWESDCRVRLFWTCVTGAGP